MQNYKDLRVWSVAHQIVLNVYLTTKDFPREEMFGITGQLRRASASIAANIVEGCGRSTQNGFAKFLQMSLGSANESEYFLLLSKDLAYLKANEFDALFKTVNEIKATLISLIKKVREKPSEISG